MNDLQSTVGTIIGTIPLFSDTIKAPSLDAAICPLCRSPLFDNDQIGQLAHIVERTASEDEVNSNDDDEPDELRSYLLQYEGVRNLRELSIDRVEELLAMIQNERERIQAQQMNTRREGGIRIIDQEEMQMRAQDEMQQAESDAEQEAEEERIRSDDEMQQAQWESEQYEEEERARSEEELQQALW
eukprot:scaffold3158_cov47-Cyclotella_meneghiniana.AAC.1